MVQLSIYLDANGMLQDIDKDKIIDVKAPVRVGVLDRGTVQGRPSVGIAFTLPDGQTVLAQTTLRLFLQAAKVFTAEYGEQGDGYLTVDGISRKAN